MQRSFVDVLRVFRSIITAVFLLSFNVEKTRLFLFISVAYSVYSLYFCVIHSFTLLRLVLNDFKALIQFSIHLYHLILWIWTDNLMPEANQTD